MGVGKWLDASPVVFWKEHVSNLCISSGKALRRLAYERNITFFKAFFSSLNTEMRFYFCRILFRVGARLSQLMFIVIIYIWVRREKSKQNTGRKNGVFRPAALTARVLSLHPARASLPRGIGPLATEWEEAHFYFTEKSPLMWPCEVRPWKGTLLIPGRLEET